MCNFCVDTLHPKKVKSEESTCTVKIAILESVRARGETKLFVFISKSIKSRKQMLQMFVGMRQLASERSTQLKLCVRLLITFTNHPLCLHACE